MGLYEFMKQKIEKEALYDYEISDLLNVKPNVVSAFRYNFGLKRIKGFNRRFEEKYGIGAVGKFRDLVEDPENSLTDVAGHFGFSRQYAWVVYRKIYGSTYTRSHEKKAFEERKETPETGREI
jgi:hypothetical protein